MRGFMTNHSIPDGSMAARVVLKDNVKVNSCTVAHRRESTLSSFKISPKVAVNHSGDDATRKQRREASGLLVTDEGTKLKKAAHSKQFRRSLICSEDGSVAHQGTHRPQHDVRAESEVKGHPHSSSERNYGEFIPSKGSLGAPSK